MENINALDEIHKGACMGMDAIDFIKDKIEDEEFRREMDKEYNDYQSIQKQIEDMYSKYDDDDPHSTSPMNKAMTWTSIEMKTMNDTSNSNLAELLLKGVNMGIIEGKKILNNKKLNKKVRKIVDTYVKMQEENVEALKQYL